MESATPMVLFLMFLFGGLWLILLMGYRSAEARRRLESEQEDAVELPEVPRFFATLSEAEAGAPVDVSERLVQEFEAFLTAERRQARRFVGAPNLEELFHDPIRVRTNGEVDLVRRLVDQERNQAREFVATPTVEGLHRNGRRPVWQN